MMGKGRKKEFPDDLVNILNVQTYRERLGDPDRQVAEDGDDGSKQARRAQGYDGLTRAYLRVFLRNRNVIDALAEMETTG
jgi:hypothetical protein